MGVDKASLDIDGVPAVEFVASRLRDAGCRSVVAVSPRRVDGFDHRSFGLEDGGLGPLDAVRTVLRSCDADWAFVIAVDHLGFTVEDSQRLIECTRNVTNDVDVVMAREVSDDGIRPQHLIALWRVPRMRPRVEDSFAAGSRSIHEVVRSASVFFVDFDPRSTVNVNTPEELGAFRENG